MKRPKLRTEWTPELATEMADALTEIGFGATREVLTLRRAIASGSPILVKRVDIAHDAAAREISPGEVGRFRELTAKFFVE